MFRSRLCVAAALATGYGAFQTQSSFTIGHSCAESAPSTAPATNTYKVDESSAKLKLVQVVFRHGARTPLSARKDFWAHDPVWDMCGDPPYQPVPIRVTSTTGELNPECPGNLKQRRKVLGEGQCFQGQLTFLGQQQAHEFGVWLRKRYVERLKFLPPTFHADRVRARTTNYDRTIQTLQGVLTGLFPPQQAAPAPAPPAQKQKPGPRAAASQQQQQQPPGPPTVIPVTTSSDLDEILYADTKSCPHLGTFMKMGEALSRESVRRDPDYGWARGELQRVLGLDDAFFLRQWPMTDVYDAMVSMKAHGKALPSGMSERLLLAVDRMATREFASVVAPSVRDELGQNVMRLSMGVLLHTIISNMESALSAPAASGGPTMMLYSGHDSTIMPLLAALGVDIAYWPPYLSNIIFELWELPPGAAGSGGQHVVRVLYNTHELQVPHCPPGSSPSMSMFREEVLGPFLLSHSDWGAACQVAVTHSGSLPQPKSVSSVVDEDE